MIMTSLSDKEGFKPTNKLEKEHFVMLNDKTHNEAVTIMTIQSSNNIQPPYKAYRNYRKII